VRAVTIDRARSVSSKRATVTAPMTAPVRLAGVPAGMGVLVTEVLAELPRCLKNRRFPMLPQFPVSPACCASPASLHRSAVPGFLILFAFLVTMIYSRTDRCII